MQTARSLLAPAALFFLVACGGEPAKSDSSATVTATSTSAAAAPAPAKVDAPEAKATIVELKGSKAPFKVAVVLPPGVREVEDPRSSFKSFRKGKDDFDGYSLTVGEDRPERAKAGMEIFLKQIEAEKASKKTRLIDKATWEGGWAVAYEFEERGKKNVGVMGSATAGENLVMCRGDASGSALSDVDAAGKVLLASCKSIKTGS